MEGLAPALALASCVSTEVNYGHGRAMREAPEGAGAAPGTSERGLAQGSLRGCSVQWVSAFGVMPATRAFCEQGLCSVFCFWLPRQL